MGRQFGWDFINSYFQTIMKLDLGSFAFGSSVSTGGSTPSWGTALGQKKPDLKLTYPGCDNIVMGMVYKSIPTNKVFTPLGKGGHVCNSIEDNGIQLAALFDKVYVNEIRVEAPFILIIYQDNSESWAGRKTLKYNTKTEYRRGPGDTISNSIFVKAATQALHLADDACWVISDAYIVNQEELHFVAGIVNSQNSETFPSAETRKTAFLEAIKTTYEQNPDYIKKFTSNATNTISDTQMVPLPSSPYRPYLTAIKSKPFLLLAGISGTGKSRIVRELARSCWEADSEEFNAQKPRNFEMVQVKPNWHDSTELIGYVSRVNGEPVFVAGEFLKFIARAWEEPEVPYFLCLDEMNLAPVEQYFAEYLSVIVSRKAKQDDTITSDPILRVEPQQWYYNVINELTDTEEVKTRFLREGICIPQNLIVVGTVNMDETTFSFSRKVLDRAMTIEMNEVDLYGGLSTHHVQIRKITFDQIVAKAVEGIDVYLQNKEVCDMAISYLQEVNSRLEGTPFKIAYRTRNEFLLYVVNNLPYNMSADGKVLTREFVVARALDEITNMKILSRIEGDETKITMQFLTELERIIKEGLERISSERFAIEETDETHKSVSIVKVNEMKNRLASGYTSFWS